MIKQDRIQFLGEVKATVNEDIALESMRQKVKEQLENQRKMEEEKQEAKEILEQLVLLLYNCIAEYKEQEEGILKPMILSKSTINILSEVINSKNYFIKYFFDRDCGRKEYFEEIINNNEAGIDGMYAFEVNTNSLNIFCESDLNYFIYDEEEGKYVDKLELWVNEEI